MSVTRSDPVPPCVELFGCFFGLVITVYANEAENHGCSDEHYVQAGHVLAKPQNVYQRMAVLG